MDEKQLQQCRQRLEAYLQDLLEPIGRMDRRHWGSVYVRGLLLNGKRKSIEPMANRLPDGNVQSMQQFIGQSPWDYAVIRQLLAERMARELIPSAAWIIDDTGFPKKGDHSVGVARQYSGTLGKIANCQIGVSLHLATDDACIPLNFALYMPKKWIRDPVRLQKAGVPSGVEFKRKWQQALDLIDETSGWDVQKGIVVADTNYGKVNDFRQGLIDRELFYVMQIERKTIVFDDPGSKSPHKGRPPKAKSKRTTVSVMEFAKSLPSWRFKTIRWREGTKGHMASRFAGIRVQPAHNYQTGKRMPPRQWLLIEWPSDKSGPAKFWFSNLGHQAGLRRLVRMAKIRWKVEQNYQQQKDELGLDHYEGRGFIGWHHHVTMNMIAYCFLILEILRIKKNFWVDPAES